MTDGSSLINPQLEEPMKTIQRSQRNSVIGIRIREELIDWSRL